MIENFSFENLWNILNHLNCGVIVLDGFKVIYINEAVEHILEIDKESLIGSNCKDFLCNDKCDTGCSLQYIRESGDEILSFPFSNNEHELQITYYKIDERYSAIFLDFFTVGEMNLKERYFFDKEFVEIDFLFESVRDSLNKLCRVKNIEVELLKEDKIAFFYGSKEHLVYIFNNIIGKIVKLSYSGSVICRVHESESGNSYIVSVVNHKTLINSYEKAKMVKRFELELDKSKEFIEMHGGKLWISLDNKVEFNFSIPKKL